MALDEDATYEVQLKCLGQLKTYTTDFNFSDDEDRGVSYETAYLVTDVGTTPYEHAAED